jgi:hypothetical protein
MKSNSDPTMDLVQSVGTLLTIVEKLERSDGMTITGLSDSWMWPRVRSTGI